MNIVKGFAATILFGVALLAAIACKAPTPAMQPLDTMSRGVTPTATPIPTPTPEDLLDIGEAGMVEVLAPIESLEIQAENYFPPQYVVAIKSGLPSGCAEFRGYDVSRDGNTVKIEVTNLEPAPGQLIRCTAIYGYHDSSINLGSDFVGGETYSVVVNDTVTETFVAQGGGTVGEDNGLQDYELAPIVEVKLFAGQTAGEAALVVISSLPTSCQAFGNYTLLEEEEVIVLDIYNALPFGRDVVCSKRYSEVTTRVELSGNYEKYRVYTARVNGKPYGLQACANRKCVHPDPVFAEVPIERLALQLAESTNQPELMITSGLQYSCYHLVINHINRGGETIYVSLYNTVPLFSGLECAEDYRTIETTVDIPGSMEPCKVYRIVMNGDEFLNHFVQAIAPDVTCAKLEPVGYPLPDEPEYPTADVPAPIESVQITKTESLPPEYLVDITFALTSECDRFNGYHLQRAGSEINISVTNLVPRPEAQVVCPQNYDLRETSINLGSSFENGIVYSVNVNFEPVKTFIGGGGQAQSQPSVAIPLGKSIELETDGLTLEFLEVTEDSRCPTSSPLPCNWVGKAKVIIAASEGGEDLGEHELLLDPLRTNSSGVRLGDHSVALVALNPYPATFDSASNAKYVATLYLARHLYSGEGSEIPKATVWAEPIPNKPGAVTLFAEIEGGADRNNNLFCAYTTWQFGDGTKWLMGSGCQPWTPESTIQRYFQQTYTYDSPGTYEVNFNHGNVEATAVIEVK